MNFLIHTLGSPTDYDSWHLPGWDSATMKTALDRLTCWTEEDAEKKPSVARSSFLLNGEAEMCTAPPSESRNDVSFMMTII